VDAATWLKISIAGYSLGGVLLIAAIFMFIKMNIPAIIGDLSGRTAARKIREIREQNTGNKRQTPKAFNLETKGFRTGDLGNNGKVARVKTGSDETELLTVIEQTELLDTSKETELLSNETELLASETELLDSGMELLNETTVLDETTLLQEETIPAVYFKIVKDLKVIHTNEVI